jgi:hypothetical protein
MRRIFVADWVLLLAFIGSVQGAGAAAPRLSPDYAPANWIPASVANYSVANRPHDYPVDMIIIHDTESPYSSAIQDFQNSNWGGSAHYVVSNQGQITQMVAEHDIAWHAGNWDYNTRAIGIEHEGYAYQPGSYTTAEYQASAQLAASVCSRWGVPMDRLHVIGHSEVPDPNDTGLFGGVDHHTDPGPYWNWTTYMSLAQGYANALPSPPHLMPDPVARSGDRSVTVSWSGRSCHAPITGYHIVGQPGNITLDVPGTTASVTVTGLQNWVLYSFTVTATNSYGQDTLTSNSAIPGPSLGGQTLGDPDVASWGANRLDVVVTGVDNALWHKSWDGTQWIAWESLGGILTSSPSVVAGAANRLDVFGRGSNDALWHRWFDGTSWHPWQSLGGVLQRTSGPASASWSGSRLDVFVRGTDDALWHRSWDGTTWAPWEDLGGILSADPGVVSSATGHLDVFVRGTDFALWHRAMDSTGWHPWERLGSYLLSAPDASSCTAAAIDVFAQAPDGLWRRTFNGSWAAWAKVEGDWSSGPATVCRPGTTNIDVLRRGYDLATWQLELPR